MKALLKIEWIKTWRSWPVFIMGIGIKYFLSAYSRSPKRVFAILYVNHDWLFYV